MADSSLTQVRYCIKCGCDTSRTKQGGCRPCSNRISSEWRAKNPERCKATVSAWKLKNSDRVKAYNAEWRSKNPSYEAEYYAKNPDRLKNYSPEKLEKLKAYRAAYYIKNKERMVAANVVWVSNNRERVRAFSAKWYRANPESNLIHNQNRRARKLIGGGVLSKDIATKLFKLQKGKCACCGLPLGDGYHIDHIMPLALGGSNTDDNIQLLTATCNLKKNSKHPVDYMQSKGFLI